VEGFGTRKKFCLRSCNGKATCGDRAGMSGTLEYRGIQYSVEPAGYRRWRWRVSPPTSVRGLKPEVGEIDDDRDEAIRAAQVAIKGQDQTTTGLPE